MKILLAVTFLAAAAFAQPTGPIEMREYHRDDDGFSFQYDLNSVEHRGNSVHFWERSVGRRIFSWTSVEIDCLTRRRRSWLSSYRSFDGTYTDTTRGRTPWTQIRTGSVIAYLSATLCNPDDDTSVNL